MRNPSLYLFAVLLLASCGGHEPAADTTAAPAPAKALFVSKNPASFNDSFGQLLQTYLSLRDAFVEYDTARINSLSKNLTADASALKLGELKDSSGTGGTAAKKWSDSIRLASAAIVRDASFEKKQRGFASVSDALYELARTTRFDKEKIFHQHCPMAFNNEGAYWISNSNEIVNPYFGKKHPKYRKAMLECGDIPDSLNFGR